MQLPNSRVFVGDNITIVASLIAYDILNPSIEVRTNINQQDVSSLHGEGYHIRLIIIYIVPDIVSHHGV